MAVIIKTPDEIEKMRVAGRLAAELRHHGVGRDDRVALYVERSLDMAATLAGAAEILVQNDSFAGGWNFYS